ncbi:MAG: hypothetical protein RR657_02605 [Peptostreptococcaceae bacterium]
MKLTTMKVMFDRKYIYIECRNCNKYIKVEEKTNKYKCDKCGIEEDLVVIDENYMKKRANI